MRRRRSLRRRNPARASRLTGYTPTGHPTAQEAKAAAYVLNTVAVAALATVRNPDEALSGPIATAQPLLSAHEEWECSWRYCGSNVLPKVETPGV
ncbi:hypothetical protein [Streptomyces sp. MS2.AVA.5]|uniref:Uncharacterized protein n=1 Tax=Streptomyces achmelvichensis TaxID=3134111 RepID=A0ACC6Q9J6_9ACTN